MYLDGLPTRTEQLEIKFELDKKRYDAEREAVGDIGCKGFPFAIVEGDTIKVSYTLNMLYFGNVCKALNGVLRLLKNPAVVVKCTHEEITHGNCLIEDILMRLRQIKSEIRSRQ